MTIINSIYYLIQHLTRSNTALVNMMQLSVFILILVSGPGSRIALAQRQTIVPNQPVTPRMADNTASLQTSSCAVTLTRMDVYGFSYDNYNGSYLVNGTINGAPSWKMDNQIIQWTGTEWQIFPEYRQYCTGNEQNGIQHLFFPVTAGPVRDRPI